MKRILAVFFVVTCVMLIGSIASAEQILTYNGMITVTPGTAPYDPTNVGIWLNVSDISGAGVGYGISYPLPSPTPLVAGSTLDHYWVQSANQDTLIYQMPKAVSAVMGFPGNDHGPLPWENLEYMMYGSNDLNNWTVGTLTAIYHDGWDPANPITDPTANAGDWYSTRWDFSQTFKYFKTVGTVGVVFYNNDPTNPWDGGHEPEMDGIAGIAVPEPASMLLVGLGFVGLAGFRRTFKQ